MRTVWHHNDLDGQAAAAIVGGNCFALDYKDPLPMNSLNNTDQLYIVDFSLKPDQWQPVFDLVEEVIWIDHHVSAIKKANGTLAEHLPGIRAEGKKAGCYLTWEYLYDTEPPLAIKYISDYDTWTFEYGNDTKRFKTALESLYDTRPQSAIWDSRLLSTTEHDSYDDLLSIGSRLLEKRTIYNYEMLKAQGFATQLWGYDIACCNAKGVGSALFDSVSDKYSIYMPFYFDGNVFVYSLYSKTVNCASIAETFGGGGHPGASGFGYGSLIFQNTSQLEFKSNINDL